MKTTLFGFLFILVLFLFSNIYAGDYITIFADTSMSSNNHIVSKLKDGEFIDFYIFAMFEEKSASYDITINLHHNLEALYLACPYTHPYISSFVMSSKVSVHKGDSTEVNFMCGVCPENSERKGFSMRGYRMNLASIGHPNTYVLNQCIIPGEWNLLYRCRLCTISGDVNLKNVLGRIWITGKPRYFVMDDPPSIHGRNEYRYLQIIGNATINNH